MFHLDGTKSSEGAKFQLIRIFAFVLAGRYFDMTGYKSELISTAYETITIIPNRSLEFLLAKCWYIGQNVSGIF